MPGEITKTDRTSITPIEIPLETHVRVYPAYQETLRMTYDDIAYESESQVSLRPGGLDLMIPTVTEDVVPDGIVFAIMLMEAPMRGIVDQVVLHQYIA